MNKPKTEIVADVLAQWADERVANATSILQQKKATASMSLIQSLQHINTTSSPNVVSIGITAEDYYQFVDEGVRGWQNTKTNTGRFKFKGAYPPIPIAPIQRWIAEKGIQVRKSASQKTSEVIKDSFALADIFRRSIKKKGTEQTLFWTNTFTQKDYDDLAQRIGQALGGDYELNFNII